MLLVDAVELPSVVVFVSVEFAPVSVALAYVASSVVLVVLARFKEASYSGLDGSIQPGG